MKAYDYPAFSAFGIEIEHILVRGDTLDVAPIADRLLDAVGGAEDMDVPRGAAAWSNELALHVIETKTAAPVADLDSTVALFRKQVDDILEITRPLGVRLMSGGMHPWMDPLKETRLWPHQNDEIYRTFDRIFDCRGHGWSNLQSTHINFPFQTEEEFHRVHSACRFILPLLPALAASSPFQGGRRTAGLDGRLLAYQGNCVRIPSITGRVIPEVITREADYAALLNRIYADLAPWDPEGILAHEWVNARGAIARFDRGAVEIRVIDTQECPEQDVAVVFLVTGVVRALASGEYGELGMLDAFSPEALKVLLDAAIEEGEEAELSREYCRVFGAETQRAGDILRLLVQRHVPVDSRFRAGLDLILTEGCLARRLLRDVGDVSQERLRATYEKLCSSLEWGRPFLS